MHGTFNLEKLWECMTQFELKELFGQCVAMCEIHSLLANCHKPTCATFTHTVTRTFGSREEQKKELKKELRQWRKECYARKRRSRSL